MYNSFGWNQILPQYSHGGNCLAALGAADGVCALGDDVETLEWEEFTLEDQFSDTNL